MNILLLETATPVCSVALAIDGKIVVEKHSDEPNAHSSKLSPFVQQILAESGVETKSLDAVCVSSGPGSYTGLRIGVSSAKGFCYALGIPLLSVPTLQGMAAQYYAQHPEYTGLVCPMIDARRMECYTAIYESTEIVNSEIVNCEVVNSELTNDGCRPTIHNSQFTIHKKGNSQFTIHNSQIVELKPVSADIIVPNIYDEYLDRGEVVFIGDGAAKTKEILGVHPNARYASDFQIAASGMLTVAMQKLQNGEHEDVAYFEPYYLKDFVAKKSVVRGLRQ